ncbi:type II secretion system F family protein [Streptomyces sp. T-3]|nr:type II secretion system F family protein [Streptomyces sp. T-3]
MSLLAVVCALLVAAGLAMIWRGAFPPPADPARRPSVWRLRIERARATLPDAWAERYRFIASLAVVAMIATWALTASPVHGLLAAGIVLGAPWIWNPAGTSTRQIVRLAALAEWLQQLAAIHEAGTSLEQAVQASAERAPQPIRAPVRTLAARLRLGVPPSEAYTAFAGELADGASDNVVLLFLTHIQDRGEGLGEALKEMSEITAREASGLRTVDADRAKVRTSTRWVSVFSVVLSVAVVYNPDYGAPYRSPGGQVVLTFLAAVFACALLWLRKIASPRPSPRLLNAPAPMGAAESEGSS